MVKRLIIIIILIGVIIPLYRINNIKSYKIESKKYDFGELDIYMGSGEIRKGIYVTTEKTSFIYLGIEYYQEKSMFNIKRISLWQDGIEEKIAIITNEDDRVITNRFQAKNKDAIIIIEYEITINGIIEIKKEKIVAKYERKIYLTCPLWDAMMGI